MVYRQKFFMYISIPNEQYHDAYTFRNNNEGFKIWGKGEKFVRWEIFIPTYETAAFLYSKLKSTVVGGEEVWQAYVSTKKAEHRDR